MAGGKAPATPIVTIRHVNPWVPDRHTPAFLQPIVAGVLRRLAANRGRGVPCK